MLTKSYTREFELTAADCNAQFELSIPSLVQNLVEVATDHANELGVGYARLAQDGNAWVLLRATLCLNRVPRVSERYVITTWVEGFNRRFSERCFEISVGDEVIGNARTVWTVINSTTRQAASLDGLENLCEVIHPHPEIDFGRSPRLRPAEAEALEKTEWQYRVRVSDIDTNRHLTAMRYLQLMLDSWPLEQYDSHLITRFEIAYSTEAHYGNTLTIRRVDLSESLDCTSSTSVCQIMRGDELLSQASVTFTTRI